MTIEEERSIDFISASKRNGTITLTISDHLKWDDYEYHSMSLQSKIDYYLEYIYSNRLHEGSREPGGEGTRVQLVMKHDPPAQAAGLLEKIKDRLAKLGFDFVFQVLHEQ